MIKASSIVAGAAGLAFSAAALVAANTIKTDAEYTGVVADRDIYFKTNVGGYFENASEVNISVNTYLTELYVDGNKHFHLETPVSMDKGDNSFWLRWSARASFKNDRLTSDVGNVGPVRDGDRVRIRYSVTPIEQARNFLQDHGVLKSDEPRTFNAHTLEVLPG
jgi:hypothetical protein